MSDDQDESSKTEDPSGRKLDKAHEEGQFAISREVNHFMAMLGILIIIAWLSPYLISGLNIRLKHFLSDFDHIPVDNESIRLVVSESAIDVITFAGVPLGLLMILGILSTTLQIGFHITWASVRFDFAKLSPIAGFKRLFQLDRQAVEMGKNLVKLIAVGIVIYVMLSPVVARFEHFIGLDFIALLNEIHHIAFKLVFAILLVIFVITAIDFAYQRHTFHKKMMMTKQEVKDEYKQTEGDPLVKGKLKGLRYQKARQRMMAAVPHADVIVTNPTHFAVAMQYDPTGGKAPVVVAKGADFIAANIRKLAEEHDIPIVRNPPLARALYDTVEIDQEIPAEHYRAVAEVITFVFKLKGRSLK
ncbi:MAG: flagellar biosynthesis protein FlhB [Rhodospirillaceae bacterium]